MSLGVIISSAVLILSLFVTAVKFFDWISHSDPRSIVRMGSLGLLTLAVASLPSLMALLAFQQWIWAMLLGAAMLLGLTLVKWRRIVPPRAFKPLWAEDPGYGPPQPFEHSRRAAGPDAELARRAAIVLQDYLALETHHHGPPRLSDDDGGFPTSGVGHDQTFMGIGEATALLGIEPGARASQIRAAHRRLMQRVHPDHGGTDYLAMKINRAKDVLLTTCSSTRRGGDDRQTAPRKTSATEPSPRKRASRSSRDGGSTQPAGPGES